MKSRACVPLIFQLLLSAMWGSITALLAMHDRSGPKNLVKERVRQVEEPVCGQAERAQANHAGWTNGWKGSKAPWEVELND
jgi:hypothetical protein